MRDFYTERGDILGSGGTAYAIVPIGDPAEENAGATTVTTRGSGAGSGLVFTYSGDRKLFTPTTDYRRNQQRLPDVGFDGTANQLDTPDAAFWSRVESGSEKVSWEFWMKVGNLSGGDTLFAKYDGLSGQAEWSLQIQANEKLQINLFDDVNDIVIRQSADDALTLGQVHHVIVTYDSGASALGAAADDIAVYVDKVAIALTTTNNASYDGMVAGTYVASIGAHSTADTPAVFYGGRFLGGAFGPGLTHQLLTAAQRSNLYDIYVAMQRATPSRIYARR